MSIEPIPNDFGQGACPFRFAYDATKFYCSSKNPRVRVNHDGTVLKRPCRICQLATTTDAECEELLKKYLMDNRKRKHQEQLEFQKKKEQIKTEALKERQRLKQRESKPQVDWGNSEYVDTFAMGEE